MLFLRLRLLMQTIETFGVRFFMGSRKLLLRIQQTHRRRIETYFVSLNVRLYNF